MWLGLLAFLFPVLAVASSQPLTDVFNGASGKAIQCKGELRGLEMLDLFEARKFYGLREVPQKLVFREEVKSALERLDKIWNPEFEESQAAKHLEFAIKRFYSRVRFIPKGKGLKLLTDTRIPIVPSNCEVVQLAVFDKKGFMHVDRSGWNRLDARNKTVLLLHSELAFLKGSYQRQDSEEIRRFLASVFSNYPPRPRFWDLPKTGYYQCQSKGAKEGFDFYIYPASRSRRLGYVMSFRKLNGQNPIARLAVPFEEAKAFYDLQNPKARVNVSGAVYSQTKKDTRSVILTKDKGSSLIALTVHENGKKVVRTTGACEFK